MQIGLDLVFAYPPRPFLPLLYPPSFAVQQVPPAESMFSSDLQLGFADRLNGVPILVADHLINNSTKHYYYILVY